MYAVRTKSNPSSVDETVSQFESETARRGLRLFAVIDHSAEALTRSSRNGYAPSAAACVSCHRGAGKP